MILLADDGLLVDLLNDIIIILSIGLMTNIEQISRGYKPFTYYIGTF